MTMHFILVFGDAIEKAFVYDESLCDHYLYSIAILSWSTSQIPNMSIC